jgi:hypothetical protein
MTPKAQMLILFSPLLLALSAACVIAAANVVRGSRRSVLALLGFASLLVGDLGSVAEAWLVEAMLRRGTPGLEQVHFAWSVGSVILVTAAIVLLILALFGSRLKPTMYDRQHHRSRTRSPTQIPEQAA